MKERDEELERIQAALLAEENQEPTAEEILQDEDLLELLQSNLEPAFDDPEQIHEPAGQMEYNNYANGYGRQEEEQMAPKKKKNDNLVIGLMITACVLCLGIIGVLSYWLAVLL